MDENQTPRQPYEPKKLYRSRVNKVIGGVCGGIGEYLGVDPTLIRIIWVLLTVLGGAGFIAYILALIIIPEAPIGSETVEAGPRSTSPSADVSLLVGVALVAVGIWYLLRNMNIVLPSQFEIVTRFISASFWPTIIILVGVLIIFTAGKSGGNIAGVQGRALYRSRTDRKIVGVAGGLAAYFGIDSTWVRIIIALLFVMNFGAALIAYIVAAIIIPEEPPTVLTP